MFESLVANLLNRFLGSYIENFDPKQLNIGIWSGDVKLKNLRLKKDSLDRFKLPIDVKFGHVGELTLQIPWSNLKGQPVKVIIEDVYLLASPIILNDFDLDEEKQKELKVKKDKLEQLSVIENASLQNQEISSNINSNETFTESLVTKIIDNLQVTIKNIHIRYEDDSILTEDPYSVGITLNELSAVSTDQSWIPSFISITQQLTRKLLKLQDLTCYMNTDSPSIYSEDPEKLLEIFKSSIHSENIEDYQYILKPVSGQGKLSLNKLGATESTPHIKAELFFEEFGIDLDSQQYKDMLWTLSKFHWYIKTHKFRKFRPKVTVAEDPRLWLQYAAKSILNEIHEKHYKWSWEYFEKRRDERKAYVKLYKLKLLNKLTNTDDIKEFDNLEEALTFEDIKFYRSIARTEVKKENANKLKQAQNEKAHPQQQGWFGGWWGGNNAQKPKEGEVEEDDLQLSDNQRKALYEAIDYSETNEIANAVDLPRDTIKMEILATLKKGGISIKKTKNSSNLAEIVFEGCKAQFYQRPDSVLTNFQIEEFRIEDGTEATLYKHIVSVKQYGGQSTEADNDPFFRVSFERNPLDDSADSKLLGKLKSMTIFYNPRFIEEVIKFFKPPKIHLDTVGAIMNAAEATVEGFTSQTRMGLQYALEEHKTINVKLDLQAPLIILPLEPHNWKSPVAILDAGHISVISNLVEKAKIEELKSKTSYSEADWDNLNTLMYDKFNLHLQDAQFLVGSNIKDTMEQLHLEDTKQRKSSILDKFNIKLLLGISILPDVYNLSRFKIGGEVPSVKLQLNDLQYKIIMQIIDAAIPNFDNIENDDSSIFNAFQPDNQSPIEELENSTDEVRIKKNDETIPEAALNQHMFEFDLKIDLVHLSLSRCIDGVTFEAEPFIDLIGDSVNLNLIKTMNDLFLGLTLDDINLIDHIERSGIPEFERLISSNNFVEGDVEKSKELFKLDYSRKQRIVDFNNKEIEVFDQDIKLDVATLKFVITRKSILSILNFVLNTFTDPNAQTTPADELKHNDVQDSEVAPQKINVVINLDSIICVLNEDSVKLATLQLSTAQIAVLVLPEALDVHGKLGALSLHDDINAGSPKDSILRNLINIEGDNLAEFTYKTFDQETNDHLYSSLVEFKTGSSKINFVESSFKRIFNYLSQFQKMKEIYDSTREAAINQANQIENANKMKFNFSVTAPIVVFPRIVKHSTVKYDNLTIELGELYATNDFIETNGKIKNVIKSGLRNINMSSEFNFINDVLQFSEMVKDFDMSFDIDYLEDYIEGVPSIVVNGRLPEVNLHLTELQLNFLMGLSDAITNVFDTSDIDMQEIEEDATNANAVMKQKNQEKESNSPTQSKPQSVVEVKQSEIPAKHEKLIFKFNVPKLALTIYNHTSGIKDVSTNKLGSFSLNGIDVNLKMTQDTHFDSKLIVKSFVVEDIRPECNSKFKEIIPSIKSGNDQFIVSASSEGTEEKKNITVLLSVDNPKVVLSLDYLFELQNFVDKALEKPETISELVADDESSEGSSLDVDNLKVANTGSSKPTDEGTTTNIGFSVNILRPSIILLADPSKANTEAVVFKIEQVLLTSQNVISLAANSVGLFLCTADNLNDQRLRIIDDFSISFAHDSRGSTPTNFLTNIQASVDPLLVRVSLRDIRLALSIFNRASVLYAKSQGKDEVSPEDDYTFSDNFKKRLSKYAPSFVSNISGTEVAKKESNEDRVIIKGEELNVSFGGLRFVLIGDVHELPVIDMNVKPFDTRAINWSTDLSAETHVESFVKIYNYSRSTWEPLIEPWPIAIYASKSSDEKNGIMVDIVSRQLAEITVTSRSIALLSQISTLISEEVELKSREETSPYKILNETGYDIEVWKDGDKDETKNKKVISNGDQIPWAFEDWREVRANLDTDNKRGILGIRLLESEYDEIHQISASGEGEDIIMMTPPVDGVHTRLICDISLGSDNIKTIWIRSAVQIQNNADVAISVNVFKDPQSKQSVDIIEIEPGQSKALPVDHVYNGSLKFKPKMEAEYGWSKESLYWKDMIYGGSALTCASSDSSDKTAYYFQAEASYDKDEPLARIYPHMKIVVSAPIQLVNLLPFDIDYRLYDKDTRKDWNGSIAKGVENYIHVASLKSLLLLSVEPKECGFNKSEFAIINSTSKSEFKREDFMTTRHEDGQVMKLKIYYPRKKQGFSGLRAVIYSPYIVLNRTGQNIEVMERNNKLKSNGRSALEKITPKMFSFDRDADKKNRALLKVGDSQWSAPISFDAIGQSSSVSVQLTGKQSEMNVGVSVADGEGVYNLTKVITIAPRYIFKHTLEEPLQIVENGSNNVIDVAPNELHPLYGLRRLEKRSLVLKFAHGSKNWSSPFVIDDIGQIFLKVYKENFGQILLKVNILTENGVIFIQVENANNNWPFSIRNFSDSEFYIYQADPNINENGDVIKTDVTYKPIYYKIPPKSVMPYAYDYPNAVIKELIIRSHGRERAINLSEIGNLKPFRLPPTSTEDQKIVDLNVVADGPTQSLIISDYDPSLSMYKLQRTKTGTTLTSSQQNFETPEEDESYHTRIITRFEGFGISLINTRYQELIYVTLRGLEVRYNESDLYQNLSVKLKWIQVDNQLYGGIFPIIIYPTVVPKSGKEMNNHPSFSASVCKVKDDSHGVLFIKYATVLLQEMTIEIDEDILFALLDFAKLPGASWNRQIEDKLCDESLELPEPKTLSESSDIYFEALHLQPTLTNLSFVRTERVNAEDKISNGQNTLMFFFNVLTMALGNINDAPIKLNALFLENIRVPTPILLESIQTHYGQSFFYQLHKILGSADVIGNPVGLFNNLSSGVLDIFYEPYQGFIINDRPQELGIGIAKGGLSFLKKSIFGFSDSFAKISGSLAKGLSVVTLDDKFQERRRFNQRRNKPKHALYGFASGANSFFESVSSGVTGFATAPIEGANTGGAAGFFKGVGKGLVGLPTKTAIGFFDLASNVSEGIRNTTTVFDAEGLDKVRLPRYISYDKVVRPYSQREAQGQFWLKSIEGGVYFNEAYLAHLLLPGEEKALILTFKHMILFDVNSLKVKWVITFDQIKSISMESTGINIGLKKKEGPFIPIPEKSSRAFLYSKISIAVEDYNKHCQVIL